MTEAAARVQPELRYSSGLFHSSDLLTASHRKINMLKTVSSVEVIPGRIPLGRRRDGVTR